MTAATGAKYPCFSLADMARLPEDVLPRMLAELPDMIAGIRPMVAIVDAMKDEGSVKRTTDFATFGKAEWIDDDKGELHQSITAKDGRKTTLKASWTQPLKEDTQ